MTDGPALLVGDRLPPVTKVLSQDKINRFETVGQGLRRPQPGQATPRNIHTDAAHAQQMGLSGPIASGQMSFAYLHELLARRFGKDFLWGGQLAVTFVKPVAAGDTVTAHGLVRERQVEGRRTSFYIEVWLENQRGERTAAGEAWVTVPSPLRG